MYKLITLAALTTLALAVPTPGGHGGAKCNTGDVQCCNTVDNAHNKDIEKLLGLLNIGVQDINVPVVSTVTP
ncbi:hypothetical protein MPER_08483, partial [Moniliophthora perniciosa FA553]